MTRPPTPATACRDRSARPRTAPLLRRQRHPPSTQRCGAHASESLPQADVDAEGSIAVALVEGNAEIEARRTEARIVAHADTGTDTRRALTEVRQGGEIGAAGVEEGHDAERLADALAEFD